MKREALEGEAARDHLCMFRVSIASVSYERASCKRCVLSDLMLSPALELAAEEREPRGLIDALKISLRRDTISAKAGGVLSPLRLCADCFRPCAMCCTRTTTDDREVAFAALYAGERSLKSSRRGSTTNRVILLRKLLPSTWLGVG